MENTNSPSEEKKTSCCSSEVQAKKEEIKSDGSCCSSKKEPLNVEVKSEESCCSSKPEPAKSCCETVTPKPENFAGNGIFYCPMHCEGDQTYSEMGDCPVCGMDLVEQPALHMRTEYY